MVKVAFQLGKEAREQVGQPVGAPGQVHLGPGPGVVEGRVGGPEVRRTRLWADGGGVQTEAQLSSGIRGETTEGHVSIPVK